MVPPQNNLSRYWLITTNERDFERGSLLHVSIDTEINLNETVYFWQENGDECIPGWGIVAEPSPTLESSASEFQFGVSLLDRISPPITKSELRADPILVSLLGLESSSAKYYQLDAEEVRALNRLIHERGLPSPPNLGVTKEESGKVISDPETESTIAERDAQNTLEDILREYKFSGLAGAVIQKAADLSSIRLRYRNKITSSCILFGLTEVGKAAMKNQEINAAQFLYKWLEDWSPSAYQNAFERFLREDEDLQKKPKGSSHKTIKLSSNATKIIKDAAKIARQTTGHGIIYGRHLVGSLLEASASEKLGASVRIITMQVNLLALHKDFFKFINHPSTDEKEIQKWREILPGEVTYFDKAEERSKAPSTLLKPFLPRIDADDLKSADYLNITPEVQAFASIIAARDVKTPLSIGLFGDWGSGKSFFMSKLKEEVNLISRTVRARPSEESAYYGNIVQIDFNAWHYVEANLWASLVSHIFDNLSFSDEQNRTMADKRKKLLLTQLETTLKAKKEAKSIVEEKSQVLKEKEQALTDAQKELHAKKNELKAKEDELENKKLEVEEKKREHAGAKLRLRDLLRKGVWAKVKQTPEVKDQIEKVKNLLSLNQLPEDGRKLKEEIAATQTVVGRAQMMFWSIIKDPRAGQKALLLVTVLILIPLLTTFILSSLQTSESWKSFYLWLANVMTLLGGAYAWLKPRIQQASKALDELEKANRELDRLYETARGSYDDDVLVLENEVSAKKAEIETKKAEIDKSRVGVEKQKGEIAEAREHLAEAEKVVETTRKEVEETKAALKEMEPRRMLATFIQDRATSTDYRQHLGIIALIRQDFKRLSELLVGQNNVELKEAVAEMLKKHDAEGEGDQAGKDEDVWKEYKIDRIVLYIDDLDRCPPKQVVDVLQAIHLLLAFELFVVVVGVDARWVRHSLKKQFPDLLSEDPEETDGHPLVKTATPRDYVEKIFQVPFWLRPMGHEAATKLLSGLIPNSEIQTTLEQVEMTREGSRSGETQANVTTQVGSTSVGVADEDDVSEGGSSISVEDSTKSQASDGRGGTGAGAPQESAATDEAQEKEKIPDLRPDSLKLENKEREAMIALGRVIGRTPRTLKRFVNVYRIIKASLRDEKLNSFRGTGDSDGEFRAVLVLLAVAYGSPELAPNFFRKLKEKHEDLVKSKKEMGLKAFLTELKADSPEEDPDGWAPLVEGLSEFADKYKDDISLAALRRWAPTVVRYTFQLGRMSEIV